MTVEVVSTLERKVKFNINKAQVNNEVAQELRKYAKTAKVQGFRPGKAPKHIVEKMYGGKVYEDILNTEINRHFVNQLSENKLNIVGAPKIDLTSSEGDDFIFAATFEIMPEVELGTLTDKEIEKPICNLSDADITTTIDVLRKERATYENSLKSATNGDKVTVDFNGKINDEEFAGGKADNYPFILGQGFMLPDFEAGIVGMKSGETKEITVNFPENYNSENLKGKVAVFTINLKNVAKEKLPELTREFIQSLGVSEGTAESLYKEVRENLQQEVSRRLRLKSRENALQALFDISPLKVPNALVHEEVHQLIKNAEDNMQQQIHQPNQIKLTHAMFENDARRIVTLRLLVQEFIKQNSITINDDEVRKVVEEMAVMYEDQNEYINWYYQDVNRINNARAIAIEQKVVDAIYAKARVKDTIISYVDIMKVNRPQASHKV